MRMVSAVSTITLCLANICREGVEMIHPFFVANSAHLRCGRDRIFRRPVA